MMVSISIYKELYLNFSSSATTTPLSTKQPRRDTWVMSEQRFWKRSRQLQQCRSFCVLRAVENGFHATISRLNAVCAPRTGELACQRRNACPSVGDLCSSNEAIATINRVLGYVHKGGLHPPFIQYTAPHSLPSL
jgi:hypothetical protein